MNIKGFFFLLIRMATTNPIGYEALESKNDDRELPVSTLQVKWLALNS